MIFCYKISTDENITWKTANINKVKTLLENGFNHKNSNSNFYYSIIYLTNTKY
jgi:hypothetical protein